MCLAQVFPGTKAGPDSPAGFATLKTLQVSPDVRQAGVAVFGRPSGKESLILKVKVRRGHALLWQWHCRGGGWQALHLPAHQFDAPC